MAKQAQKPRASASIRTRTPKKSGGKRPPSKRATRSRAAAPNAPKPSAPKKAMDYAAEFDWPGYFNAVAGKDARETLVKAMSLFDAEDALASKNRKAASARPSARTAIDIGCGEGRDTRALLRHKGAIPWSLLVSDGSAKGIDILLDSLHPAEHSRLCAVQCMMELLPEIYATTIPIGLREVPTPQVDLINASFSLPFCSPRGLTTLWAWIAAHIRTGGRFAGQLFGDRDTWAHARKTTGISRTTLNRMFENFVFEELREEEKDDRTTMGELKHWHVFHIVARKRQ